jgi:hypothetical protein
MRDLTLFYSIENELKIKNTLKHSSFDNESRVLYACDNSMLYGIDTDSGKV